MVQVSEVSWVPTMGSSERVTVEMTGSVLILVVWVLAIPSSNPSLGVTSQVTSSPCTRVPLSK